MEMVLASNISCADNELTRLLFTWQNSVVVYLPIVAQKQPRAGACLRWTGYIACSSSV